MKQDVHQANLDQVVSKNAIVKTTVLAILEPDFVSVPVVGKVITVINHVIKVTMVLDAKKSAQLHLVI